ncbi:MAG: response regulator transcription factor [Lachnospiraceae bacterium]|nr:response regulator transcription factor [Lachnospiraceae bacterium]
MLRVAVYDCRKELADRVKGLLTCLYRRELHIFTCESIFALENYVFDERNGNVDILFVGLSEGEEETIGEIAAIQKEYPNIQVTFIADRESQALNIFQANPAFFMLRPVQEEQIQKAMNRMFLYLRRTRNRIIVFESARETLIIPQDDILYIESNRREITFVLTRGRREKGMGKLDELETRLEKNFIRCHQSYIVNADKVRAILTKELILYNGWKIPVSRARHKEMKKGILEFFEEGGTLISGEEKGKKEKGT